VFPFQKWQLGTVFIPDSIGYLIGTNFFGNITYKYGQLRFTALATILVGASCLMIPNATTMARLLPPHFALGLGIGIVDAALVPMLATFMDANSLNADNDELFGMTGSHYGLVYAIQQTAVSLAYSLAPIVGGELAQNIGFPWLMVVIGSANLIYSGYLILSMKSLQVSVK
jgi:MFS transporter, DHA1 family, solute carrier family 18 (vesicular amine transporter), member 1/2